jgi:hypothetical protein
VAPHHAALRAGVLATFGIAEDLREGLLRRHDSSGEGPGDGAIVATKPVPGAQEAGGHGLRDLLTGAEDAELCPSGLLPAFFDLVKLARESRDTEIAQRESGRRGPGCRILLSAERCRHGVSKAGP